MYSSRNLFEFDFVSGFIENLNASIGCNREPISIVAVRKLYADG